MSCHRLQVAEDVLTLDLSDSLGVPYHSWRISHAKHHASTGHMTQDQVYVPKTRSELKMPAFDSNNETLEGSTVSQKVMKELWEAVGDSPIVNAIGCVQYLVCILVEYILFTY